MTPQEFVAKWRASPKDERRHSHSHFNDLCALIGVPDPATAADPGFTFEKGAASPDLPSGRDWCMIGTKREPKRDR
jgi:hypothetical protein